MIIFDCPQCGVEMEVSDKKAGRHVKCVACGEYVEVFERLPSGKKRKRAPKEPKGHDYMEPWEYAVYGIVFFFTPCISLLILSTLYVFWQEKYPNKAFQLNQLGWGIAAVHAFAFTSCICVSCLMGNRGGGMR
jgi:hypothetical protein